MNLSPSLPVPSDSLLEIAHRHPPFPAARERALIERASNGDPRARDLLVLHNLRLVIHVAQRYQAPGSDFDDLVQEGIAGLIRALDRFDPQRSVRFSTYAHWWIRQAISRFVKGRTRLIHVPENVLDRISRVTRAQESGVEDVDVLAELARVPAEKLPRLLRHAALPLSLDHRSSVPGDRPLARTLQEPRPGPEEHLEDRDRRRSLWSWISSLPGRLVQVLELRYGQGLRRPAPFTRVARTMGLSPERVRQLERQALQLLRADVRPLERAA